MAKVKELLVIDDHIYFIIRMKMGGIVKFSF